MTRAQKESLRDAIIADLKQPPDPVQWKSGRGDWRDGDFPSFNTNDGSGIPIEWRPKPPEPPPPLKSYIVIMPNGCWQTEWHNESDANREANRVKGDLVELTETSRVSFADKPREPLRGWGQVNDNAPPVSRVIVITADRSVVERNVELYGGRMAEFVEVVK